MIDVNKQTYFAVIDPSGMQGFVLDAYPDERDKYKRELKDAIVGEFDTFGEAMTEITRTLQDRNP